MMFVGFFLPLIRVSRKSIFSSANKNSYFTMNLPPSPPSPFLPNRPVHRQWRVKGRSVSLCIVFASDSKRTCIRQQAC